MIYSRIVRCSNVIENNEVSFFFCVCVVCVFGSAGSSVSSIISLIEASLSPGVLDWDSGSGSINVFSSAASGLIIVAANSLSESGMEGILT